MEIAPGSLLRATSIMDDEQFSNTVLLITEYNSNGAIGFVINQIFDRKLNDLVEFRHSRDFPLYKGGPVETEKLFFIHQCPQLIDGGVLIHANIYLGGDITQAVRAINNKSISESDIKIFVGYCGWDSGELEAEVEEGCWEAISHVHVF